MLHSRRFRAFFPTSALLACFAAALGGACASSDEVTAAPPSAPDDSNRTEVACQPGTTKLCYDGADATRDVGLCHPGITTCLADGSGFGPCEEQVTPAIETCATAGDDDCNGSTECEGVYVWAKSFGDSMDQIGSRAVIDSKGFVALAGTFSGSIDLGGGPLKAPAGTEDGFVAKLTPMGEHIFTYPLAGRALDVAVDHEGSVFVASLEGSCIITKISPFGVLLWTKDVGGEPSMTMRLAVDAAGNLIAAGRISTVALDFGGGPVALAGGGDVYVAKLNGKGDHVFSKTFGDDGAQQADGVAIDSEGTIYVAGRFDGTLDIGGPLKSGASSPDLFLAKLSPQGESVWAKGLYGDTAFDYAGDVAVDANGDVFVTGSFAGNMSFDAQTMSSPDNVESLFVAKFNGSSKAVWMKSVAGQKGPGNLAVDAG
ncbi:MAG TPA: hypothetical protein VK459_12815, partial [Polyangiaceae bacterium]|nr:hypothetical protein [Polyangiaceae bacterium]